MFVEKEDWLCFLSPDQSAHSVVPGKESDVTGVQMSQAFLFEKSTCVPVASIKTKSCLESVCHFPHDECDCMSRHHDSSSLFSPS